MKTRDKVVALARQGEKSSEIAKQLEITPASVCVHLRRHHENTGENLRVGKATVDYSLVQQLIDKGVSCRKAAKQLSISKMTITDAIARGDIKRPKRPEEMTLLEYLQGWNGREAASHFRRMVKKKIVAEGYAPLACADCGLTEWRGRPAPLELDHIDGEPSNNTLSNLRILCLHCHTQTPTFGWRNVHRKKKKKETT